MGKKYILSVLLAISVLTLVACGDMENVPATESTPHTTATQTLPATVPSEETTPEPSMGVGERGDYDTDSTETLPGESQPEESQPESTGPEESQPEESKPEESQPEATPPEESQPEENTSGGMTFSQYNALSPEEQEAFIGSFPTLRDFIDWWNAAKAAEESGSGDVITGDPSIDLGDFIP